MGATTSAPAGEFFYDKRNHEWRWLWDGQWWSWVMFGDDDLDMGVFSRMSGCWVSDVTGQRWHEGPDPDEWMRRYRWRSEQRRRWMERSQRRQALRRSLSQKMPPPLVEEVLQQVFSWAIVSKDAEW